MAVSLRPCTRSLALVRRGMCPRLPQNRACRERAHICSSTKEGQDRGLASLVGTRTYTALEIGELIVILGVVDAGYSGDWSRIGAISKATEQTLQEVVWVIAAGHTVTAAAAGWLAAQDGRLWLVPALKGFLFGALGLYEETSRKQ